ncbi:MAG: Hsp20/alpha crystallin family protein [Rhodospirillales bacterium]|nr:Hsp20/alpha crystallin family protein [Rhodospirillales bacterium]
MLSMRDLIPWSRGRDVAAGRTAEHPLMTFQREFDRLFDDLWRGVDVPLLGRGERAATMITPRIELREKEGDIIVSAELPGLQEKDVEVTLVDNVLSIRGEKKVEKEEKEEGYTYSERSYGAFERRIPIDAEVMADKVEARFADGVLTVTLPKNPSAQAEIRRIPIGGEAAKPEAVTSGSAESKPQAA